MAWRPLDDLVANQLLESRHPDSQLVGKWLVRSSRDRDLARDVLVGVDRDRAMAVAYEAGFRACAGMVNLAGYRVTSQPGHHRAVIEAAAAVLGPGSRPLMRRLDAARRFRNETLYGDAPAASKVELDGLIGDVSEILEVVARRLAESDT